MLGATPKRALATLAVVAGLLAVAGPAGADRNVSDGTSNTLQSAAARQAQGLPPVDSLKVDTEVVDY